MKRGLGTKRRERKEESDKDGTESFWTVCPYCYYLYEYEIVYLDCCLRCQNCKMAFDGVAISGPLPKITMVEGRELYKVSLALFRVCYSYEDVAVMDDEGEKDDVESSTTVGYKTEDIIDVDAGSNNIQRRRVIANHDGTSGHLNIKEFCEILQEKFDTSEEEDDRAKQEIKQSQSRTGGLMADLLINGLESEHESESKSGELEFYMDGDDIYVGLADL